jgi:capsular exopolysaccharide synthesis family protein
MTMYLAIFGSLLLGCGLAYLRDMVDQRLRSTEEVKHVTGMQVLGVVPHIQKVKTAALRGQQLHADPMSDVAESYRTIRTALYFGSPAGAVRTLLITSPAPGEGKSTLASNLAIAMAQAGNRILLLDADFRKPTQHKTFEIEKHIGLSTVLANQQTLEEAIRPTMVNGLDVLPCGPIPANPSEILNSQMFADVLDSLAERYDHVLVDSPPVMPVTDARILAANCDATLLALRAEKSTRRSATYARDVLRSVGARLLGVVVNDVPRRKGLYGYYYSDSEIYRYGYGHGSAASAAGLARNTTAAASAVTPPATAKSV